MNWILFGLYIFCVLSLLIFVSIVLFGIGDLHQYSYYLARITRIYFIMIIVIALFGGYMVLTQDVIFLLPDSAFPQFKLEF